MKLIDLERKLKQARALGWATDDCEVNVEGKHLSLTSPFIVHLADSLAAQLGSAAPESPDPTPETEPE